MLNAARKLSNLNRTHRPVSLQEEADRADAEPANPCSAEQTGRVACLAASRAAWQNFWQDFDAEASSMESPLVE